MNKRRLSVVLFCLAAGCAHGRASDSGTDTRAGHDKREQRADAKHRDATLRAERRRNAEDEERVEIPDARRGRGRMATAGDQIPAEEQPNANLPSSAESYGTEPDNTRVNERDRQSSALTPFDQSEKEDDRELTQRIRKAVVGEDGLSFTAKNVKIITRDGHVTLRGTVKSQTERALIQRIADDQAGPQSVTNEIEVAD